MTTWGHAQFHSSPAHLCQCGLSGCKGRYWLCLGIASLWTSSDVPGEGPSLGQPFCVPILSHGWVGRQRGKLCQGHRAGCAPLPAPPGLEVGFEEHEELLDNCSAQTLAAAGHGLISQYSIPGTFPRMRKHLSSSKGKAMNPSPCRKPGYLCSPSF